MPHTTTADGVTIAYHDVGDGPAVVLVHGITDSGHDWAPIVDRLASTHRCLVPDLRGHGRSGDAADYGALAMARDVAAVVGAAGLSASPAVVGHSLGGVVVTAYAAGAPTRAVVNVDQPLRFSDFAGGLAPLADQLRGDGFHDALAAIFASMEGGMLPAPVAAELAEHRRVARQDVVLGVWELVLSTPPAELDAIAQQLGPAITGPYLSLHGLPLAEGYAHWLRALLPQVAIEEWQGHGHYLHLVDPDRFVSRLRAFLAD